MPIARTESQFRESFTSDIQRPKEVKYDKVSESAQNSLTTLKENFTPTNVLLGLCLTTHAISTKYPYLYKQGVFYLPKILEGEVWRVATGQILHADPLHLVSNMYALYNLGSKVEKIWGALGFAQIAAISTAAEVLAASAFSPNTPAVGLSGILCGMHGALVAHSLKVKEKGVEDALNSGISFMITQYLFTTAMKHLTGTNISFIAHASGYAAGMVFGWLSSKKQQNE